VSTDTRTPGMERPRCATGPVLRCAEVAVTYGDATVLHGVDLEVGAGELVALLGASGSGKSTLLHVVAGLLEPTAGEIWLNGERVAGHGRSTPPDRRNVGLVFQNFALWPHIRVIETVGYPLRRAGRSRDEARASACELLEQLGIAHLADQRPTQLSGGEQQRVGLARALARNAQLYLLDEPTAHLDTHLRAAFQEAVLARRRETGAAIVYATHDAGEALGLADRLALVEHGRLIQIGTPEQVYAEPISARAAMLTGPCSLLTSDVRALDDATLAIDLGDGEIAVPGGGHVNHGRRRATIVVRPDWVCEGGPFTGRVAEVAFCGPHTDYHLEAEGQRLLLRLPGPPHYPLGSAMRWSLHQAWVLDSN
jgi:iron(III) transport system ATP-binding protein